ncbi:unnamed protein product [Nezara viridula]|uniref:Uncharacterized protein n=1 Tax=Nezara viridula TaxID=85310 RepID=A0A9P0HDW9_NEZVI|nr:unnamed protein product [Nezara viridula]
MRAARLIMLMTKNKSLIVSDSPGEGGNNGARTPQLHEEHNAPIPGSEADNSTMTGRIQRYSPRTGLTHRKGYRERSVSIWRLEEASRAFHREKGKKTRSLRLRSYDEIPASSLD